MVAFRAANIACMVMVCAFFLEQHGYEGAKHFNNVFDASRTIEQYRQFHNEISMKFYQMSVEKQALEQKVLQLELELQKKYEL